MFTSNLMQHVLAEATLRVRFKNHNAATVRPRQIPPHSLHVDIANFRNWLSGQKLPVSKTRGLTVVMTEIMN